MRTIHRPIWKEMNDWMRMLSSDEANSDYSLQDVDSSEWIVGLFCLATKQVLGNRRNLYES